MFYCDVGCQTRYWKTYHKHGECKLYIACDAECGSGVIEEVYSLRLVVRLMIGCKHNGLDSKSVVMFDGSKRSLKDLPDTFLYTPTDDVSMANSHVFSFALSCAHILDTCDSI